MSDTPQMTAAMVGARAALQTMDKLLDEFFDTPRIDGITADTPFLSVNDVRRLLSAAEVSMDRGDRDQATIIEDAFVQAAREMSGDPQTHHTA
jgi:hypothetical protein